MTDKLVMLGQLIADAAHSGPVDYETGTTIAAPLAGWVDVDITGVGVVGVLVPGNLVDLVTVDQQVRVSRVGDQRVLDSILSSVSPSTSSATVSRTSGWSVASGTPTVYLRAGWAHLEGIVVRTSGSSTTIGTIPAEFRPPRTVRMELPTENPSSAEGPMAHLEVTAAGELVAEVRATGPSWTVGTWFILPCTPWSTT